MTWRTSQELAADARRGILYPESFPLASDAGLVVVRTAHESIDELERRLNAALGALYEISHVATNLPGARRRDRDAMREIARDELDEQRYVPPPLRIL